MNLSMLDEVGPIDNLIVTNIALHIFCFFHTMLHSLTLFQTFNAIYYIIFSFSYCLRIPVLRQQMLFCHYAISHRDGLLFVPRDLSQVLRNIRA
jgi:hypothetical protein